MRFLPWFILRIYSTGIWRRAAWHIVTNVLEEYVASVFIFHFYPECKDSILLLNAGDHLQYNILSLRKAPLLIFRIVRKIGLNFTRKKFNEKCVIQADLSPYR